MTAVLDVAESENAPADDSTQPVSAGWWARAGAFSVDVLLGLGVAACAVLLAWSAPVWGWVWWTAMTVAVIVLFAVAINRWLIPVLTGWSLGRLLVGVVVVRTDGNRFGLGRLLIRDMAHLLDTLPLFLGWLWPLWDSRRRTFADLLTRTEVRKVIGERPERRRMTSGVLAGLALVAVALAGIGYFGIYRPQAAVDETRKEIAKVGPQVVVDMLSYEAASIQDDFAKSLTLVTDSYRPQLEKQQAAVRKAAPVDNDYWVTNSAVLKAAKSDAVMLLMLQGQRGAAPNQRLITATVQVTFQKSSSGQWQVADLSVLAKPNNQRVVEETVDPNAKPAPPANGGQPAAGGQPAPAPGSKPAPAPPAPNAQPKPQPNPPKQGQ